MNEHEQAVRDAARRYQRTEQAHEQAREDLVSAVVKALASHNLDDSWIRWRISEAYVNAVTFLNARGSELWIDELDSLAAGHSYDRHLFDCLAEALMYQYGNLLDQDDADRIQGLYFRSPSTAPVLAAAP